MGDKWESQPPFPMVTVPDPVLPLTPAERATLDHINKTMSKEQIITLLRSLLETAVTVELATIPIYLFTYYSINRLPQSNNSVMMPPGKVSPPTPPSVSTSIPDSVDGKRAQELQIFANKAGAIIMSVAVEEMLHMSLSSNMLYAFGGVPELYRKSPGPPNGPHYPVNLPGHAKLGPDGKPMLIPLASLSYNQLWKFLEIEWPERHDALPEPGHFKTIGQVYSYIRCLTLTNALQDYPFGPTDKQLQPDFYSPNNIDTAYAKEPFDKSLPAPRKEQLPTVPPSASNAAVLENSADSHAGMTALVTIDSIEKAQEAIATICDQGEGYNPEHIDPIDDPSGDEDSHYYKFLCLQSCIQPPDCSHEHTIGPKPPKPDISPITPTELTYFVFPFPENPITRPDGTAQSGPVYKDPVHQAISDALNGLYQYMLILTETSFKASGMPQKKLFYQGMHMSMIWIMDKLIQQMRTVPLNDGSNQVLAPTFENFDLGPRATSFAALKALAQRAIDLLPTSGGKIVPEYNDLAVYLKKFATLPDVAQYW